MRILNLNNLARAPRKKFLKHQTLTNFKPTLTQIVMGFLNQIQTSCNCFKVTFLVILRIQVTIVNKEPHGAKNWNSNGGIEDRKLE